MSVREKLNDKKLGIGVAIGLVLLASLALGHFFLSHWTPSVDVTKLYYSDDDGQTYFKDSAYKIPPFDHDGKTAVQAVIAESGGHRFVGFLTQFTPDAHKKLQQVYDDTVKSGSPLQKTMLDAMNAYSGEMQVKLPGSGNSWIPSSRIGTLQVKGPDGKYPDRYIDHP